MHELLQQLISWNEVYVGKWSLPWVSMSENHDARRATLDDIIVTSKEELIVAPQAYIGLPFKKDISYRVQPERATEHEHWFFGHSERGGGH